MEKIDLKVEPLKYVSEESFKPYGQIFGLEKGKPTEDYLFIKCWWKNININAPNIGAKTPAILFRIYKKPTPPEILSSFFSHFIKKYI